MRLSKTHTTWDHFIRFVHFRTAQLLNGEARVRSAMIRDGIGQRLYVVAEVVWENELHDVWVLAADTKKGVVLSRALKLQEDTHKDVVDCLKGQTLKVTDGFFVHLERLDAWA